MDHFVCSYRLGIEGNMTGIPKSRIPNIFGWVFATWVFTTLGIVEVGYSVLLPSVGIQDSGDSGHQGTESTPGFCSC